MQKDIKELLQEVIIVLDKIRVPSLKDTLEKYINGQIDADEAKELLIEFSTFYKGINTITGDDSIINEIEEFVKIGDTDISIYIISSLTKIKHYSFKDNDYKYGIIVNRSNNDFGKFVNITFFFKSEKERDKEYLKLMDILCIFKKVRFN